MYTRTLAQLRTSFRVLASIENSTDMTDAVCLEYLNNAIEETYQLCVASDDDYYVKLAPQFSLVLGQDTYALPLDFFDLRKVERQRDSTRWFQVYPISIDGANRRTTTYRQQYRYRISNLGITFDPVPQSTDVMRIYYWPLAPQLALDTDSVTFDRPVEMKLVLHVAMRDFLLRSDLETGAMDGKIAQLKAEMRTTADSHDEGEPFYLSDYEVDDAGY